MCSDHVIPRSQWHFRRRVYERYNLILKRDDIKNIQKSILSGKCSSIVLKNKYGRKVYRVPLVRFGVILYVVAAVEDDNVILITVFKREIFTRNQNGEMIYRPSPKGIGTCIINRSANKEKGRKQDMITGVAFEHNGKLFKLSAPSRHSDVVHLMVQRGLTIHDVKNSKRGFIYNGDFIDEKEATRLTREHNLSIKPLPEDGMVTSYDLW